MPTTAVASLVQVLGKHRLLPSAQLAEVEKKLLRAFPDTQPLLKELVRRGWLTAYQAQRLGEGKGAELVLGPYLLLQRLGAGGGGQVYKARHQKMDRLVALKVIRPDLIKDPEVVQRFYREIEVASQMSHPNIVHAFEAGPMGALLVLVMEYVDGPDLERLVRQAGPLPVPLACEYVRQAAVGLQYAYERGLVHRDIKPSNLLVSDPAASRGGTGASSTIQRSSQQIKILDLGLARLLQPVQGSRTAGLTIAGGSRVMQGTPDYMSPEQALDFHAADIRSDIYSLGCTFYFLLTGKPPFAGKTLAEKLMKHQQAEAPPIQRERQDIPPALSIVMSRMLAKRPEDRYQTPDDVAQALAMFVAAAPPTSKQTKYARSRPRLLPSRLARWRWAVLGVAGAIAVCLGVATWLLVSGLGGRPLSSSNMTDVTSNRPNLPSDWTVLEPTYCGSSLPGGATLTKLPDQSILASGAIIQPEQYFFTASTKLTGITGIRLEVLPDPNLPSQGPGRAPNGNFVLSQLQVLVAPAGTDPRQAKPVVLQRAIADFAQESHGVANAIDGVGKTGWAVDGSTGRAHAAVFELKEPIGFAEGTTLTCKLDQQYVGPPPHPIGRFRIAVTTRKPPLSIETPSATPAKNKGGVVFSDDFESGAGKWTVVAGNFSVVSMDGRRRYQVINLPTDDISRAVAGDATWSDYTFQAKLRISDLLATGAARLLARYQDTYHWYGFAYYKDSGTWRIVKREGGEITLATGPAFGMDPKRYYAVKVEVNGATMKLYVDGALQATANDAAYPCGKIGLSTWRATALFDDVSVTVP